MSIMKGLANKILTLMLNEGVVSVLALKLEYDCSPELIVALVETIQVVRGIPRYIQAPAWWGLESIIFVPAKHHLRRHSASGITAFWYSRRSQRLWIVRQDAVGVYANVPENVYYDMLTVDDLDTFFDTSIHNAYYKALHINLSPPGPARTFVLIEHDNDHIQGIRSWEKSEAQVYVFSGAGLTREATLQVIVETAGSEAQAFNGLGRQAQAYDMSIIAYIQQYTGDGDSATNWELIEVPNAHIRGL